MLRLCCVRERNCKHYLADFIGDLDDGIASEVRYFPQELPRCPLGFCKGGAKIWKFDAVWIYLKLRLARMWRL
jgi:hypothetical protein